MRIAYVVHDFNREYGHSRYVVELARRYRAGHDVHIYASTADAALLDGITYHHVPSVSGHALAKIFSFLPAAAALVRGSYDIIHAQGLVTPRFNVVTAHICNRAWFDARRQLSLGDSWRQRAFESLVVPAEAAMYRRSRSAEVIAISGNVRHELAKLYGRTERVSVVRHGVDVDQFDAARWAGERDEMRSRMGARTPGDVVALFVGDLRKGVEAALRSLALVPDVQLAVVSRGDPTPYRHQAAELGVSERVHFLPGTPTIAPFYAAADLFLFPTPYDAFGMVITEAMSSGLPVITTRQAGASELIDRGRNGYVVDEASDHIAIAAALRTLALDGSHRRAMGRAAREVARELTWDSVAKQTMVVYQRARSHRHPG